MLTDNLTKLIACAMTMSRGSERLCSRTMLGGSERPRVRTRSRGLLLLQQPGHKDQRDHACVDNVPRLGQIALAIALADDVAKLREITLATSM